MNFETHDIVLASTLKLKGCQLEEIIIKNGRQGLFCFSGVTEQLLKDFDFDNINVEPKTFNITVRNLNIAVRRLVDKDI